MMDQGNSHASVRFVLGGMGPGMQGSSPMGGDGALPGGAQQSVPSSMRALLHQLGPTLVAQVGSAMNQHMGQHMAQVNNAINSHMSQHTGQVDNPAAPPQ